MRTIKVNPLNVKPGDIVKDLRPLQYGKLHVIHDFSKSKQFEGWLLTDTGILLNPASVVLIRRANGHLV